VGGGDLSSEAETSRARRRLVVGIPLVGNQSEMQPTGRRLDVLPVWVLTVVLRPPVLNLGLDIINLGFHVVNGVGLPFV
jgi:hypothetical protein